MPNWDETWPDGSAITPQPGMLVDADGEWSLIDDDLCVILPELYAVVPYDEVSCTPLAPPPTPGGLWDALLAMSTWHENPYGLGEECYINLEHGYIRVMKDCEAHPNFSLPDESHDKLYDHELPAHMRDMQKYGALLAYTQQGGW